MTITSSVLRRGGRWAAGAEWSSPASTSVVTSAALRIRIRSGGLGARGVGAGGASTSPIATFPGERTNSWATSTGYSPRHRDNLMWERSTRRLLPRVTRAVTRKLRHLGRHDLAGRGIGKPPRTVKRLPATRPGRCWMVDDRTAGAD